MRHRFQVLNFLVILCLTATVRAQGSAASYGQGTPANKQPGVQFISGLAGTQNGVSVNVNRDINGQIYAGAAPGFFTTASADENRFYVKPEDENPQGLWETRSAILTPGDRVEYKFSLRQGETLLASVTSDAFDPALSIVDSNGKEIFKNDDREEGDQSPFVIYRVPASGSYTLKVLSFHSVAGGKFQLSYRTFLSMDTAMGDQKVERPTLTDADHADRVAFRMSAKKGTLYDLRNVTERVGRDTQYLSLLRILGPTGVAHNDFKLIPTPDGSTVMEALADGDYYVEYSAQEGKEFHTGFREVQKQTVKDTCDESFEFEPGEIKIIEFPVLRDQIIRTTLTGPVQYAMSAPANPNIQVGSGSGFGTTQSFTVFQTNVDDGKDFVRIFHEAGAASVAIRSISGSKDKVGFKNSESLPEWAAGQELKNDLKIGEVRLFLVASTKSELMRVHIAAGNFVPRLDIFRMDGELANSLSDRKTLTAGDDLYFPDPGKFVVRLTCDGFGGAGDFTMLRKSLTPTPYALGTATLLKLDGANFGLFSVNLQAGKRYELLSDQPGNFMRADLLDEDGQFLTSQDVVLDNVKVQYFVPTRSGVHRLWLRGEPGTRHFKFQLNVPPVIGAG